MNPLFVTPSIKQSLKWSKISPFSLKLKKIATAVAILSMVSAQEPAYPMIIRHDIDPSRYVVAESEYPSVFPLFIVDSRKECVATLIDTRWAITAAHCLLPLFESSWLEKTADGFRIKPFGVSIAGETVQVVDAFWPQEIEARVRWSKNGTLKSFKFNDLPAYDIALLKLSGEVDHVSPIALYTGSNEVGKTVTLLGWGDYGTGDRGIAREQAINDGLFRQATNQIIRAEGNQLFFDFDPPESGASLPLEGVNGPGDSGGPALVESNEGYEIIGISSGGYYPKGVKHDSQEGRYGWREYYVRVSAMMEWIQEVIGTSGK